MDKLFKMGAISSVVGTAASFTGVASSLDGQMVVNDVLTIIYLILGILGAIGTIIVVWVRVYATIKAKWDSVKKDGKVTSDEIVDVIDTSAKTITKATNDTKDIIDKINK